MSGPRRTRRLVVLAVTIAAWLAVGAVITVGVAWACVLWSPPDGAKVLYLDPPTWPAQVPASWPKSPRNGVSASGVGVRMHWARAIVFTRPRNIIVGIISVRSGWPLIAMRSEYWAWNDSLYTPPHVGAGQSSSRRFAVRAPAWLNGSPWLEGGLPAMPIPLGFAVDAIFYAALAFGLFQIPFAIRRVRRRRLGRCVRCGYDLTGLAPGPPCPECGGPPPAP